jgi:hypothetical protein
MRRAAPALLALTLFFVPVIAMACPGAKYDGGGGQCCGSSGTAPGLGIGMILGIGSVALENVLRKRR